MDFNFYRMHVFLVASSLRRTCTSAPPLTCCCPVAAVRVLSPSCSVGFNTARRSFEEEKRNRRGSRDKEAGRERTQAGASTAYCRIREDTRISHQEHATSTSIARLWGVRMATLIIITTASSGNNNSDAYHSNNVRPIFPRQALRRSPQVATAQRQQRRRWQQQSLCGLGGLRAQEVGA